MKINRYSLINCLTDIVNDEIDPVNPVLVYNKKTGVFSIQSNLNDMNDNEYIISDQLDIYDSIHCFLDGVKNIESFVNSLSDKDIEIYLIGLHVRNN